MRGRLSFHYTYWAETPVATARARAAINGRGGADRNLTRVHIGLGTRSPHP